MVYNLLKLAYMNWKKITCLVTGIFIVGSVGQAIAANGLEILDRERDQNRSRQKSLSQPIIRIEEEGAISRPEGMAKFTLDSLKISGATVFSEKELLEPYESFYGKSASFNQINNPVTSKQNNSAQILLKV